MLLEHIKNPDDLKDLSIEELQDLSSEIRDRIIDVVSKNGGHLASSLGVVELTLAIHRIFHQPYDNIIWDVGHQAYAHKIITGRNKSFDSLRRKGGISGFPKTSESKYDAFNTGHSSTSVSAAQGMQIAIEQRGMPGKTVAVIGDGALTGGMAYEALNYTGHKRNNLVVILNDNEMSISKNVGALSMYLHRLRLEPAYTTPKDYLAQVLKKIPGFGKRLYDVLSRIEGSFKYLLTPGMFFEELGFKYIGPVDGYDFVSLEKALVRARDREGPVLVHVLTQKGKGYLPAEEHANLFHGVGPFDRVTGQIKGKKAKSYTSVFGNALCRLAEKDKSIVAITAAMEEGTGLTEFASRFPTRFFDVGIAEEHGVTMAAGMAKAGLKPVVAIYSTFMQRAYDQLVHDAAMMHLPVVFCLDRAGLVGEDGSTHHGVFDVSLFRTVPGIQMLAPSDDNELELMLEYALKQSGPVILRYPRGPVPAFNSDVSNGNDAVEKGRSKLICNGKDVVIWALGGSLIEGMKACSILKTEGISAGLVNPRFIKPFDSELLLRQIDEGMPVVTVEENVLTGGFGSLVAEKAVDAGKNIKLLRLGIPDSFVTHGTAAELRADLGLDAVGIANRVKDFLKNTQAHCL